MPVIGIRMTLKPIEPEIDRPYSPDTALLFNHTVYKDGDKLIIAAVYGTGVYGMCLCHSEQFNIIGFKH